MQAPQLPPPTRASGTQAPPGTHSDAGDGSTGGAAYTLFVIVCIAGMVLICCLMCALGVFALMRYKKAQREKWLQFQDSGDAYVRVVPPAAERSMSVTCHATADDPVPYLPGCPRISTCLCTLALQSQPLGVSRWPENALLHGHLHGQLHVQSMSTYY